MSDVKRWKCDCEFIGTDFVADQIEAVRASDYDALAAERDRLREALQSLLNEMALEYDYLSKYDVYQVTKGEVERARAALDATKDVP